MHMHRFTQLKNEYTTTEEGKRLNISQFQVVTKILITVINLYASTVVLSSVFDLISVGEVERHIFKTLGNI